LVGSVVVVLLLPVVDEDLGFVEGVEGFQVEEFAAEVAVEGLDVRVLPGCSGLDVGDRRASEAAPVSEGFGGQLGPVVATDHRWRGATLFDDPLERANGVVGAQAASCRGR
jgi:hypothetical protein